MASEIRVNRLSNRSGLSTITFANGGVQFSGITTFANGDFRVGTGATILNPSTNEMQFHTGGSNRFTINNSGANLGTGNITAVDATFTGNVSIGKTLTYEDVKNVDSVGVVTARTGVKITGGDFTVGTAITASSVTGNVTQDVGITTFSGSATWFKGLTANKDMYWSKSSGSLVFKDNAAALFGDGSDLQIYHSGSHSFIKDSGSGSLIIQAQNFTVTNPAGNESMIHGVPDGTVELYFNGNKKLETTNTGIDITGDAHVGDSSGYGGSADNLFSCGASDDIKIYHHGSWGSSYINHSGSSALFLESDDLRFRKADGNELYFKAVADGSVELYYDNTKRFETTSSGVTVTGAITVTGEIISNNGTLRRNVSDSSFTVSGDTASNTGANINLYGASHGSLANVFRVRTGSTERLRIASNGKVYIGPYQTDFSDAGTFLNLSNDSYGGRIGFRNNTGNAGVALMEQFAYWGNNKIAGIIATAGTDTSNKDDGYLTFYTRPSGGAVTERLRIASDGKVYIGNTSNAASQAYFNKELNGDYVFHIHSSTSTVANRAMTFNIRADVKGMEINSLGRVMFGPDAQDIQLIPHSTNSGHGQIYFRGNASNESSSIKLNHYGHADYVIGAGRHSNGMFSITRSDTGTDGLLMNSSGKIKIGGSPETLTGNGFNAKLQVNNVSNDYDGIMIGGGYNRSTINTGANYDLVLTSNAYPANATSHGIRFKCGSSGGGGPNERMRIYSEGYVTKPAQPRFMAYRGSSSITSVSSGTITGWNNVKYDVGSNFSNGTKFTAPVTGVYMFGVNIRWGCSGQVRVVRVQLDHYNSSNGGKGNYGGGVGGTEDHDGSSGYDHPYTSFTDLVEMDAGDYVQVSLHEVAYSGQLDIQAQGFTTNFWGCLMF